MAPDLWQGHRWRCEVDWSTTGDDDAGANGSARAVDGLARNLERCARSRNKSERGGASARCHTVRHDASTQIHCTKTEDVG